MDLEKEYNMEDKHSFYVLKFTNFTLETNYMGLELGKKHGFMLCNDGWPNILLRNSWDKFIH